jgi:hypothetical protein
MQLNTMPRKEEMGIQHIYFVRSKWECGQKVGSVNKTNLGIQTTPALIASYDKENFILYLFWCICDKLCSG